MSFIIVRLFVVRSKLVPREAFGVKRLLRPSVLIIVLVDLY